ncbi:hypothetical protein QSJ18_16600 [Gordonia sp. ABSL1-1]|uniref:hypothetical protein n=1 Tax=Gordonia sp. ABSL1-1 TaxID=3053923 RepID=UPI00257300DE|nr:hypothetical protein [Gordonia sp. ABSL1-1]MDL9938372.1 hypothetical protein [Gordonia sp. ABSL1-1]
MADASPDPRPRRAGWWAGLRQLIVREWHIIRGRDPDLDASDITEFSGPLLAAGLIVLTVGLLPLIGTRITDHGDDAIFGPLIGSFALAAVCTTAIAWLLTIVICGMIVLIVYRVSPRVASATTEQAVRASFHRISDMTSTITLVALISGLVSLAIGLPGLSSSDQETSVLEELLSAQVACLLLALVFGFTAEAIRTAAEILGSQVQAIAWLGALVITTIAYYLAATAGPFEPIALTRNLLTDWLPADVDGVPRAEIIADALPRSARAWAAGAILPFVGVTWAFTAWRTGELAKLRNSIRDAD